MSDTWDQQRAEAWAGERTWKFSGYYKYTFSFEADADGIHGLVNTGSDSGDIYRYDVEPEMTWLALRCGETDLWITDAAGHTLYATSALLYRASTLAVSPVTEPGTAAPGSPSGRP